MSAPLKYPFIRSFPPAASFQPIPDLNGGRVMSMPDYKSQAEAAWAVVALFRELGLPVPVPPAGMEDWADRARVELDKPQHAGRREAVEAKIKAFIKDRKLTPPAVPQGAAQVQGLPQAPQAPQAPQTQPEPAAAVANPSHAERKASGRR